MTKILLDAVAARNAALNATGRVTTGQNVTAIARSRTGLVVGPTAGAAPAYSMATLIADMTTPNSNGWFPGLPNVPGRDSDGPNGHYAYVACGIRRADGNSYLNLYLSDRAAASYTDFPWWVVTTPGQIADTSTNCRAQIRNFQHWMMTKARQWVQIQVRDMSGDWSQFGGWYPGFPVVGEAVGFVATTAGPAIYQSRSEASNGGGSSLGSITAGNIATSPAGFREFLDFVFHGFPMNGRSSAQSDWVNNVEGTLTFCEQRLIPHDPSLPFDYQQCPKISYMGSDWGSGGGYVAEHFHGRWKQLTADWQLFSATDIDPALLAQYPLPGFTA